MRLLTVRLLAVLFAATWLLLPGFGLVDLSVSWDPDWPVVQSADVPPIRGGMLAAPLTGRDGNNLGVIYLSDRNEGAFFTGADEAVLVQLAQMASMPASSAARATASVCRAAAPVLSRDQAR